MQGPSMAVCGAVKVVGCDRVSLRYLLYLLKWVYR